MADHYYGVDIGATFGSGGVSTGTSTTSKNVEIRIRDGVTGMNKTEVLKAIEKLEAYITVNNAPA
jgi:hypothetical protein